MKDKLKEIVVAVDSYRYDGKYKFRFFKADENSITKRITVYIDLVRDDGTVFYYATFSLSDLIFNHEFMMALLGEEDIIVIPHVRFVNSYPANIYHILEAAKLPTDQERIDYVHGLIKGESE